MDEVGDGAQEGEPVDGHLLPGGGRQQEAADGHQHQDQAGGHDQGRVGWRPPLQLEGEADLGVGVVAARVDQDLVAGLGRQQGPLPVVGVHVVALGRVHPAVQGQVDLVPVRRPRAELELALLNCHNTDWRTFSNIFF